MDLSLEEVLFPFVQKFGRVVTNRMSPVTGGIMFLSGVSMFLILRPYQTTRNLPGVLGSLVAILGLIGTTGYLFGTPLLHGGEVIPLAVTTTIAFLLLGVGLTAAAGPDSFPLRTLSGPLGPGQDAPGLFAPLGVHYYRPGVAAPDHSRVIPQPCPDPQPCWLWASPGSWSCW